MTCKLVQNIKHTFDYNPGGITNIYLLDINDFEAYQFSGEGLYDKCYVEKIKTSEPFRELDAVNESTFTESYENGIYKQELTTFVRTLSAEKLSNLLLAKVNRYLIVFRTSQGLMYTFGSDGGASLSHTQITGQMGEASGYQVTISKSSVYPLFEIDSTRFNVIEVLGTENKRIVTTEDRKNAILIYSGTDEDKIKPDAYESLDHKKGSIFHIFDRNHPEGHGFALWDWDKNQGSKDCRATYKTISIDEYYWTTENLIGPVSTEHGAQPSWGGNFNWIDFSQAQIDQLLGYTGVSYYDFTRHFGTFFTQESKLTGYKNPEAYKIYTKRPENGGSLLTGWEVPDTAAMLQLIGECPRHTGDFWTDVKEFLFCRPDQNKLKVKSDFYNHKNISGLSLVALGGRINSPVGHYYDFGGICQLMTKEPFYTRFVDWSVEDEKLHGFYLLVKYWHFAAVRYCKAKSDEELGYKLYIDETNDRILMYNNSKPSSLPELPKGLERGVALRHANRKLMTICKSWSEIQKESNELRRRFTEYIG